MRPVVDLLPRPLADIADVEIAVRAIEREAPRIPQSIGVDLPAAPVQPQELAEVAGQILRVVRRIAAGATVAGAGIEPAVGTKLELTAVVVVVCAVVDGEQPPSRGGNRAAAPGAEGVDLDISGLVRVVDVEAVVPGVCGMERDGEQPLLGVAAFDAAPDVEERATLSAREGDDSARALDDVEAAALT